VVIGCVAGLLIVLGLVFAMIGIYESLALEMPRWQSGLIVGSGAVVLSGLLLVVFRQRGAGPGQQSASSRRAASGGDDGGAPDLEDMVELAELITRVTTEHRPKGIDLTIAGFVAGLVASQQLKSRGGSSKDSE
jgi:hypothetical protein